MQAQPTERAGHPLLCRRIPTERGRFITLQHLPNKTALLIIENKRGGRVASITLETTEVQYLGRALVELLK